MEKLYLEMFKILNYKKMVKRMLLNGIICYNQIHRILTLFKSSLVVCYTLIFICPLFLLFSENDCVMSSYYGNTMK